MFGLEDLKKTFYLIGLLYLTLLSCTANYSSKDPLINDFIRLSNGSSKMKITYGDSRIRSVKIIDTIITSSREIRLMKEWIQKSENSDTCYKLTGNVTFITEVNNLSIDFGLSNNCPSFYYYVIGKPITLKMPYQCGQYLRELMIGK